MPDNRDASESEEAPKATEGELRGKSETGFLGEAKTRAKASNDVFKAPMNQGQKDLKIFIAKDPLDQWDDNIKNRRSAMDRPMLTENLLPMFHKRVSGNFRMNTPATKVAALDGKGSAETADVIRGLIYNIRYQSQADVIHQRVFDHLLLTGFGTWGLTTQFIDDSTFEQELRVEGFKNQFAVRIDPNFEMPDTSDKKYAFVYQTLSEDQWEEKFPGEEFQGNSGFDSVIGTGKESWEDEKKCQIAKYWYMNEKPFKLHLLTNGQVVRGDAGVDIPKGKIERTRTAYDREIYSCLISPNKILTQPTRWVDDHIIPIFYVFGELFYLDGEMIVKSFLKDGIQTQQMHNYNITALVEQISLQPDSPWIVNINQIKNYLDIWNGKKKSRYMPVEKDPAWPEFQPRREQPPTISEGLFQMPQYTAQRLHDMMAMPEANLGKRSNERSGVAIENRAKEGDVATYIYVSNFNLGLLLESKLMVETIPDVYDTPRAVRILGIDGEQKLAHIKQADPNKPGAKIVDPEVGKYGAAVEVGPSQTTQRQEARDTLIKLLEIAGKASPQGVAAVFPKIVKATDMPDSKEIADIFAAVLAMTPGMKGIYDQFYAEKEGEQQFNIPPELMQQMQAMQQQLAQAQQIIQKSGQEIQVLKNEERVKMADIAAKKELKHAEIVVEQEKMKQEFQLKERELLLKRDIDLEKIRAQMAADLNKHAVEQELKVVAQLEAQAHAEEEKAAAAAAPAEEPKEKEPPLDLSPVKDLAGVVKDLHGQVQKLNRPRKAKKMQDGSWQSEPVETPDEGGPQGTA